MTDWPPPSHAVKEKKPNKTAVPILIRESEIYMEPELWLLQCKEQHTFLGKGNNDISSCSDSSGGSILLERAGKKNCEANEPFGALRKDTRRMW